MITIPARSRLASFDSDLLAPWALSRPSCRSQCCPVLLGPDIPLAFMRDAKPERTRPPLRKPRDPRPGRWLERRAFQLASRVRGTCAASARASRHRRWAAGHGPSCPPPSPPALQAMSPLRSGVIPRRTPDCRPVGAPPPKAAQVHQRLAPAQGRAMKTLSRHSTGGSNDTKGCCRAPARPGRRQFIAGKGGMCVLVFEPFCGL